MQKKPIQKDKPKGPAQESFLSSKRETHIRVKMPELWMRRGVLILLKIHDAQKKENARKKPTKQDLLFPKIRLHWPRIWLNNNTVLLSEFQMQQSSEEKEN